MSATPVCGRGALVAAGQVLRAVAALAAMVLLTGCLGTGASGTGNPGTGNPGAPGSGGASSGNGYGGQGGSADGGQDGAGGIGGDGGDGYGGWGSNGSGNGYGGDGGSADGGGGTPGIDGAPGNGYSSADSIVGSGRLTSRLVDVSNVNALVIGSGFVVRLDLGPSERAKITMDDNLADRVQATVTGGELRLGLTPGAQVRDATLTAEITVARIDRLATSGASRVELASAPAGSALRLVATGASAVTGPVQVDRLQVTASGAATLALSGRASDLQLRGAGTSRLPLVDLAVRNLDAVLSGASHATVTVSDTLAAQTTGAAVLRYRGSPNITRKQTSGASSIVRDAH